MDIRQQIEAVLSQKMSRENFMKHAAIVVIAFSGVGNALRLLMTAKHGSPIVSSEGYGGDEYGGSDDEPTDRPRSGGIS